MGVGVGPAGLGVGLGVADGADVAEGVTVASGAAGVLEPSRVASHVIPAASKTATATPPPNTRRSIMKY
jgi:hypothetical protein